MITETVYTATEELGELTVRSLTPLERHRFLKSLQKTLTDSPNVTGHIRRASFTQSLPVLFVNAPLDLINVMAKSTRRTFDDITELDRGDLTGLMLAIIIVNHFDKIFEPVK